MKDACKSCRYHKPYMPDYCKCVKYGCPIRYGRTFCISWERDERSDKRTGGDLFAGNEVSQRENRS